MNNMMNNGYYQQPTQQPIYFGTNAFYPQQSMAPMGAVGYGYQQPVAQPMLMGGTVINPIKSNGVCTLSDEDKELLARQNKSPFEVTPTDVAKARCNHVDENGVLTIDIIDGKKNIVRCNRCKQTWKFLHPTQEAVEAFCNEFLNLFQTMKTLWKNPTKEYAQTIYSIQTILQQMPELWRLAEKSWKEVERQFTNQVQNVNSCYPGGYPNYNPVNYGGYPTPVYQQPPMGYQQPSMGYQQMPMNYQQAPGYQPQPMPIGGTMMGGNPFTMNGEAPVVQQAQTQQPVYQQTTPGMAMQPIQPTVQPVQQQPIQSVVPNTAAPVVPQDRPIPTTSVNVGQNTPIPTPGTPQIIQPTQAAPAANNTVTSSSTVTV